MGIMLTMVTQNKFKPYSPMCYKCYGSTYLCNRQNYYKICPCVTCIVRCICTNECETRHEFIRSYGLNLKYWPRSSAE